jgi:hypothetical protein
LKPAEALAQVRAVCAVVDGWQAQFAQMGVAPGEVESLAQQINRSSMRAQRGATWASRRAVLCGTPCGDFETGTRSSLSNARSNFGDQSAPIASAIAPRSKTHRGFTWRQQATVPLLS